MDRLDDGSMRLRSGATVWRPPSEQPVSQYDRPVAELETDIVVVGAGVTGAFLAERFTRSGRRVVLIDRRAPATGSTAASTAMLLWELDASLLELEGRFGLQAAAQIAMRCRQQVAVIDRVVNELAIACDHRPRSSLYLAGNKLDAADLREELRVRAHAGIDCSFLSEGDLAAIGFQGEGALLSDGAAEADPVKLALGLLEAAKRRGAVVLSPATAETYETTLAGVTVETREGDIVLGQTLVLANGYEMPDFVPAARHELVSSWALATDPLPNAAWPGESLVWEAAEPYLYMRSTADGRVIIGGEDEAFADPGAHDGLTPAKIAALVAKVGHRCPALANVEPAFAWSGVFGQTDDSLPLIGPVPGRPRCLAAFGYGGNGITFSAMAAEMLDAHLRGVPWEDARLFALDRA